MNSPDDDAALVAAVAAGDRAALAALFDRHATVLLGLAMAIVRDQREAEDLLHEVFLDVWRSAAELDPEHIRARTWLALRMRARALEARARLTPSHELLSGPPGDPSVPAIARRPS